MKRRIVCLLGLAYVLALGLTTWSISPNPLQAQAKEKKYKEGEYDVLGPALKEPDPIKKIGLLDQWKQKYPETDYAQERLLAYMQAYQQSNQLAKAMDTAKELLKIAPKDFSGNLLIAMVVPFLGQATPQILADGKAAGQTLLTVERPPNVPDAAWAEAQKAAQFWSPVTLGWVAMQEKQNETAEQEFTKALKANPQFAQASLWLGTVVQAQKNPDKNTVALFHFARAAAYDGPGALPAASRQQMDAFVTKSYTNYHGQDPAGLAELKKIAKANAFPPADFKIRTKEEIAAEQAEELQKKDPLLAFFVTLKQRLTDEKDAFWQEMKGKGMPPLKGTVLSATPAARPKTLTLAMTGPATAEVTLTLDEALPRAVPEGTVITFDGAEPTEYTPNPFMIQMKGGKITAGLPQAPAVKKAPAKKAAAKKAP